MNTKKKHGREAEENKKLNQTKPSTQKRRESAEGRIRNETKATAQLVQYRYTIYVY